MSLNGASQRSTAIDLGPLAWCLGEIKNSFQISLEALEKHLQAPDDKAALQKARTAIHQANGAMRVIDVSGVPMLSAECENLLSLVESGQLVLNTAFVSVIARAYQAINEYLADLLKGREHQPVVLYPQYRQLLELRKADRNHPADLFFPDLTLQAARIFVTDEPSNEQVTNARAIFERSLLVHLRDPLQVSALTDMAGAIELIQRSRASTPEASFWAVMVALFKGLKNNSVPSDIYAKRVLMKLNLQVRKMVLEGAPQSDRLLIDALFLVARADQSEPSVAAIQNSYQLSGSVPANFDELIYGVIDPALVESAVQAVAKARGVWEQLAKGQIDDVKVYTESVNTTASALSQLPGQGLSSITKSLQRAGTAARAGHVMSEQVAIEIATAILYVEQALEMGGRLSLLDDRRAAELAQRLEALLDGRPVREGIPEWLANVARRAQDQVTLGQLVTEMQANLQNVESAMDAYFRDPHQTADLKALQGQMSQVSGALALLDHRAASKGAKAVSVQIEALLEHGKLAQLNAEFADVGEDGKAKNIPAWTPDEKAMRKVADNVGSLGFFVESLQRSAGKGGNFNFNEETGEFGLVVAAPKPVVVAPAVPEHTVPPVQHIDLAHLGLPSLELVNAVAAVDAAPVVAAELIAIDAIATFNVVEPKNITSPPAVVIVDREVDEELMEIFLGEAQEVLEAISHGAEQLSANANDHEALTNVRRGFHTLKGSGRMVGLKDFGEAGWSMEQTLNLWVAEKRSATPVLLKLIQHSQVLFAHWVQALTLDTLSPVNPDPLAAAAQKMRDNISLMDADWQSLKPQSEPADALLFDQLQTSEALIESVPIELQEPISLDASAFSFDELVLDAPEPLQTLAEPDHAFSFEALELDSTSQDLVSQDFDETAFNLLLDQPEVHEQEPVLDLSDFGSLSADFDVETFDIPLLQEESLAAPVQPSIEQQEELEMLAEEIQAIEIAENFGAPSALGFDAYDAAISDAVSTDVPSNTGYGNELFEIFLSESDDLLAVINAELSRWTADKSLRATEKGKIAFHSLAGSSAVMALDDVHNIAKSLEAFLLIQMVSARPINDHDLTDFGFCVERLNACLHAFAAGSRHGAELQAVNRSSDLANRWATAVKMPYEDLAQLTSVGPIDPNAAAVTAASLAAASAATLSAQVVKELQVSTPSQVQIPSPVVAASAATLIAAVASATVDSNSRRHEDIVKQNQAALEQSNTNQIQDELDADLAPIFVAEASDLLPEIGDGLRSWQKEPTNTEWPKALMRQFHTVKGSARMAGAMRLGQVVHEMESRVEAALALPRLPASMIDDLQSQYDIALNLFEVIRDPALATSQSHVPVVVMPEQIKLDSEQFAAEQAQLASTNAALDSLSPVLAKSANKPMVARRSHDTSAELASANQSVRVRADMLDRLVNEAGEVSIARARLENEIGAVKQSLTDLTDNVSRLRTQLREIEIQAETQIAATVGSTSANAQFDPLEFDRFTRFQELTRMMAESVNDVATVQQNMLRSVNEAIVDLTRQGQITRDLQQDLMRVRMVQFSSVSDRLYRVVRLASKESEKRVNLELKGASSEIDRSVLERMVAPIEHLLRNAVGHGIESTAKRKADGKADIGEIVLEIRQEGNEVVVSLSDDGAGLNYERIRERGEKNGLINPGQVVSNAELADLIFMPGFSTATEVTSLAGRGVGMDVVRAETAALGGRIEINSDAGKGTRFTLHLPLTLAVTQVVLMSAGDYRFSIPSVLIEQVMQFKPQALAAAYSERSVMWQAKRVPFQYMGTLLELPDAMPIAQRYSPVVVLRSGAQHLAVHVDNIVGNQEVVVKNVGPQLARLNGIAGGTVLGDGEIVLIMNPVQLSQAQQANQLLRNNSQEVLEVIDAVQMEASLQVPATIMVVDDSLTVRKVTQRLLSREGFQVVLAKDGVDGLRQLQDQLPDVMLVDIEMPRMDGFDFTRAVRADERTKHIPIIMITSRTADKHRNHALSLGVNIYLGKPYSDTELLTHIEAFIEAGQARKVANA
jgi:chemosensory pili system protein ChpA (sensor histidine kinase/response regulator)